METSTCSGCGKAVSGSDVLYTADARIVCQACSATDELLRDESRAAGNIKKAAYTCLGMALLAWFFNPFFIVNVGSIVSGIYAIKSVLPGNERFSKYLDGTDRALIWGCAGVGIGLTALEIFAVISVVAAVGSHHHY